MLSLRELRHHRHAFVNRASDLDNTASIANSFDPSDSSGGGLLYMDFRFGRCSLVKDFY